jgi:hypothetical protein
VKEFVWRPLAELKPPITFAFGKWWWENIEQIDDGITILGRLGDGGTAPCDVGYKDGSRQGVVIARASYGGIVVAEKHSGPPPGPPVGRTRTTLFREQLLPYMEAQSKSGQDRYVTTKHPAESQAGRHFTTPDGGGGKQVTNDVLVQAIAQQSTPGQPLVVSTQVKAWLREHGYEQKWGWYNIRNAEDDEWKTREPRIVKWERTFGQALIGYTLRGDAPSGLDGRAWRIHPVHANHQWVSSEYQAE